MAVDKLVPNDARVKIETAQIRGVRYQYLVGRPEVEPVATMVLIHGFPDLSFGWRNQIPYFMSLGFQVVVPDMLGYGGTEAPEALERYTMKNIAADIRELAQKFVGEGQIILGGHDWGGAVVWRVTLWYPELIKGVFSVCTPFSPPNNTYVPLKAIIDSGHLLNFRYQLQLAGPDVQNKLQGKENVRQFLNAMYGGRTADGKLGFTTEHGALFEKLPLLEKTPLLSDEEMDFYVGQYMRNSAPELRGPLNWYRTRELNFNDEQELGERGRRLKMPALFISATHDDALPPSMAQEMGQYFDNLTRRDVKASHWALWQAPEDVNAHIGKWVNQVFGGTVKSAL